MPVDTPVLHADDEGVLRGRAVFETLRVYGGAPFRLAEHLGRLAGSAARVDLPEPDPAAFAAAAADAIAASGAGRSRASLPLDRRDARAPRARPGSRSRRRCRRDSRSCVRADSGSSVVEWSPGALAGAKSTSYAANMAAQAEAQRRGADDALLVDPAGTVLEAPTANVWWREGDRLLTPTLELPILAGITRAVLVELAPAAGYEVEEGVFRLERLAAADEVFLSSSVREVMPVTAIDGAAVGGGAPGPAAQALQRALRAAAGYPLLS